MTLHIGGGDRGTQTNRTHRGHRRGLLTSQDEVKVGALTLTPEVPNENHRLHRYQLWILGPGAEPVPGNRRGDSVGRPGVPGMGVAFEGLAPG